jgi:MADS-box transcription factor
LSVDMNDYPLHRPMTIPQPPMPLHHPTQLPPPGGASSLPISIERHTSTGRLLPIDNQLSSQKKPRLAPNVSVGSSPKLTPDDSMYNGYLPSPTSAQPPNSYRQNGQSSHQLSYSYLDVAPSTPQQPFLPSSSFDFPSSSRGASISRTAGYSQRASSAYPHHQDAQMHGIYQLMRHNLPPGQAPNGPHSRSQQSPGLLSAFLDNSEDHRQPPTQPSQFGSMDWPSHASSQQSQAPPGPQQESGHSGDTNWLDFLSHSAPQPGGQLHMTLPLANGRDGLSWERDRDVEHYTSSERGGNIDKSMTNGTGVISPSSRKRPRADSVAEGNGRPSPTTRAKTGLGLDSLDANGDAHGPGVKEE